MTTSYAGELAWWCVTRHVPSELPPFRVLEATTGYAGEPVWWCPLSSSEPAADTSFVVAGAAATGGGSSHRGYGWVGSAQGGERGRRGSVATRSPPLPPTHWAWSAPGVRSEPMSPAGAASSQPGGDMGEVTGTEAWANPGGSRARAAAEAEPPAEVWGGWECAPHAPGSPSEPVEAEPASLASGEWDVEARLRALDWVEAAGKGGHDHASTAAGSSSPSELSGCAEACMWHAVSVEPEAQVAGRPSRFVGARAEAMRQRAEESFLQALPDVLPPPSPFRTRAADAFLEGASRASRTYDGEGARVIWPWEQGPGCCFGGGGYALPKQQRASHRTDNLRVRAMNASMADGKMGVNATGVRHWRDFCAREHTPHDRPLDPNAPLWVKLDEEMLAMQFCCALVEDRGVQASTAAAYFGQVQGWHSKEHGIKLAAGLKLARLPAMLKGLRRVLGEAPRAVRRGIAPPALRRAMDLVLDPAKPAHANIRAALAVALQGLLRSAEYACDPGVKPSPAKHLMRADITELSAERLVLMMLPCKNMRHLAGKTCPLVIGAGGEYVDAVAEVRNMLEVDPTPLGCEGTTPLFRDPATGQPLRTNHLRDVIRELMRAVGEPDPSQFGTHSLRIGGATALFVAGADETVIRTMGRWSSDCYRLYVRACFESTLKWSRLAGSTQVHDLAGEWHDEVDFY